MARAHRREHDAPRKLRGHVLERVQGEIYLAGEQGLVERAGKDAPPVDNRERGLGQVVARRSNDAHLDVEAPGPEPLGAGLRLGEGEPGPAGAEDEGTARAHGVFFGPERWSSTSSPSRARSRRRTSALPRGCPASPKAFISLIGPCRSLLTREWLMRSTASASAEERSMRLRARESSWRRIFSAPSLSSLMSGTTWRVLTHPINSSTPGPIMVSPASAASRRPSALRSTTACRSSMSYTNVSSSACTVGSTSLGTAMSTK